MSLVQLDKIYELRMTLSRLEETISRLRSRLYELEEAKRLLEEKGASAHRVYRMFGDRIMIEVSVEEARRFLEDEIEALRIQIERLEREYKEKLRELQELERRLRLH